MLKKLLNAPTLLWLIVPSILFVGLYFVWDSNYEKKSEVITSDTEVVPQIDTSRDHEGDTFSVVAYDPVTGQIGGAATSCYGGHINFLNDIIRSPSGTLLGAIHTQAAYAAGNQNNARARMLAGNTPAQIIAWLAANDCCSSNANTRQYGIVGISSNGTITTAGYTGSTNGSWAGNITGIDPNTGMHYAIQGNILDTSTGGAGREDILNDMESSFRNATGTLANKLMAALQGAKRVGGDNRCVGSGNSGLASFIRVLRPSDPIGTPYINLSVFPNISYVEPIDVLQCSYDTAVSTPFCRETISSFPYVMDFETKSWEKEETCSVRNAWIRSRFATPSANTGPGAASQGTLYAFVEASDLGPDNFNTRSVIGSPCFEIPTGMTTTLSLDYHMYGANMGTLRVTANDGSGWVTLWTLAGNQGNSWNTTTIDLSQFGGSTVKLRMDATTGNGEFSDFAVDNIQITVQEIPPCPGVIKTWNGSSWSPSGVPGATNTVIINGYYNTLAHGNLTACTLTINSGITFRVNANGYANIKGDITVNGDLIIEHQGSVVQYEEDAAVTNNGLINVNYTTPYLVPKVFVVMGSPMTAETRNGAFGNSYMFLNHLTENFVPNPDVAAQFPGAENFADDNRDNWINYTGAVNVAEGYIARPQLNGTDGNKTYNMTFQQGTLNTGDIDFTVKYNGTTNSSPNVLANPYPSAISAADFIEANAMVNEVYFWNPNTPPSPLLPGAYTMNFSMEDISMYNLMGGNPAPSDPTETEPSGYISTGQGFGIKATAAGTATFTNVMRVTGNNNTAPRPAADGNDRIWIKVKNEQYQMQNNTLIGFSTLTTSGLDQGYDSKRLANVLSLYTHFEDGNGEFGIQSREAFEDGAKVLMGFSSLLDENLEYTISIKNIQGPGFDDATVFLIDNELNILTNLSQDSYTFKVEKGTYNSRFTLLFRSNDILGDTATALEKVTVYPNPTSGILNIISPEAKITTLEIFDISGRRLKNLNLSTATHYEVDLASLQSAIYFVKINTDMGSVTKQLIKQ